MQVEVLSAAPLPGGVKVARRSVKPLVLVRVQVWQPFSGCNVSSRRPQVRNEKEVAGATPATLTISDGWQSSNAPVPKTEWASGLRGCNPYTIRQFPKPQLRKE